MFYITGQEWAVENVNGYSNNIDDSDFLLNSKTWDLFR